MAGWNLKGKKLFFLILLLIAAGAAAVWYFGIRRPVAAEKEKAAGKAAPDRIYLVKRGDMVFSKVAFQQSGKACTMTSLILSHLVNSVVDSIETSSLSILSDTELIFASTSLGSSTLLKVSLGIPYELTK